MTKINLFSAQMHFIISVYFSLLVIFICCVCVCVQIATSTIKFVGRRQNGKNGKRKKQDRKTDLLHLLENTFDRKRIYANPSSYPNPKAQLCFRPDEMTSFLIKCNNTLKNSTIKPPSVLSVSCIKLQEPPLPLAADAYGLTDKQYDYLTCLLTVGHFATILSLSLYSTCNYRLEL